MRRDLVGVGVALTVGFAFMLVAALQPALGSVWAARPRRHAHRQHRGAWQLANWVFAVGIAFTLAGLAALTGLLNRQSAGSTARR